MPPRDNDSLESSPLPQKSLYRNINIKTQSPNMDRSDHKPKRRTTSKSSRKTNSTSRYLDEYNQLTSRHPILSSLFKNEEQFTSSLAALDAATLATSSKLQQDSSPSFTFCLVLGDGRIPRTAVLAALQYGWSVVAIEENLDAKWEEKPRPLQDCRFMGYKGNMSQFLSEGLDDVEYSLCPISEIKELVIICMEGGGGYDTLKSLRGRLGVSDLRVLYNNVSATIVSISSEDNSDDCPLKQKPSHYFVDEDILSNNKLVQVWNVKGTRRLSDMESNDMPRSASRRANPRVAQLQRQQDLARQNKMKSQKKIENEDDGSEGSYQEKPRRKSKSKRKSKRNSNVSNELVPVSSPKDPPVTVSSFLSKQNSIQREQETYRYNTVDDKMLLTNGDDEDGYGNHHYPVSSKSPIIDTVPSDHPSSSIIQTHRTCTVCHRTLSRSQFSERDRYLVHLSLGPGAVCRTCSMTVAATKLKMMPNHGQLLNEYANRGEYLMNNGQLPALGYTPADRAAAEGALVLHDGSNSAPANATGNELVPFEPGTNANNTGNPFMVPSPSLPTMSVDVNAPFSGILPEEERPTHIADCKYIDAVLSMPCYPKLNSMELFASSKDVSVSMAALDAVKVYGTMDAEYFVAHDGDGKKVIPRSMKKKNASGNGSPAINPKSIMCLVIGEGSLPRTAVLAALHYGWTTLSIDPTLDEDWDGYQDDVPNYTGYSGTISEFMCDEYTESHFELDNSQSSVNHLVIIGVQMTKDEMRLKGNSNINEIRARYDDIPTTLVSMSPLRKATLAPKRRDGQCGSKLEKDVGYEPNCSYIDEGVFSVCRLVEVWNFHNEENKDEDEESIEDDDEYSKESIGNRHDRYRDVDYEKRFSMERLSLEEYSDDYNMMHNHLIEHKKRVDNDRKKYDRQKRQYSRNNTIEDSVMSGSTLSTKGTMPRYEPEVKRNSKIDESGSALILPIASRLERENTERKSRTRKKDRKRKKKSSFGPRPIPDDIPEDLEINSSNFVGGGPPQPEHQELVDWISDPEQTMENDYSGTNAIERKGSSGEKQDFKSGNDITEDHHLSDVWNGAVAKYDEQSDRDHSNDEDSTKISSSQHREFDEQPDHDQQESHHGDDDRSFVNSIGEGSYSSSSGYHGKEEIVEVDSDSECDNDNANLNHQKENEFDDSDHSSNEFDDLRNKVEYYGYDDDQSSNYVDRYEADHTSTNSGIACLNDYNASQNKIDQEEDDEFHCWSDNEELKQTQSTSPGGSRYQKVKPWHRKEGNENSFASCDSYE